MSSSRHDRVSQLFLEAVGLPAEERRAFLEDQCADDTTLIRDVEDLIARDTRPAAVDTPVLDRAVAENVISPEQRDPCIPSRIARYEIVDVLGRGGMGVVYRARQTNPSREVALKVVHPFVSSATLSRRVEFEAQVLGRLQHPGIAQIFEAGSDQLDGRPLSFFAMELVDGLPIDKFVRKHRLSTEKRLDLLIRVCDAVQHAHQKGVIHRDLKPANILVTADGQPKVLDFGIARVTDADIHTTTLKTNVGQLLGTIAYMSPEQVSGDPADIDTRSDVYALGILGYQLLTGHLPYDLDNKSVPDAARIIRDLDPTMLGTIDRDFRGDVEIIIGKALEKDKTRRYDSVAEFAADIQRHLGSEPIAARRPSMMYQLGKFARRNTALVGGVVAVFVLLVASILVTSVLYLQAENARVEAQNDRDAARRATAEAQRERDAADTARADAQRERDAAVQTRAELHDANTALTGETAKLVAVNHFLGRMLESANPLSEIGYASKDITVLEMLDREAANVEKSFPDQPAMQAALQTTFGSIYAGLGRYNEAEKHYRRALELHSQTGGANHKDTARATRDFAATLAKMDRLPEAVELFNKALDIDREVSGEDSLEFALTESRYGFALLQAGRLDDAEPMVRDSVEKLRRHLPTELEDQLWRTVNNLARIMSARGKYDEAEALYNEALEGYKAFYGDAHATIASGTNNLARMRLARGDLKGAAAGFREADRIVRAVAGDDHPLLGTILNNLAYVQENLNDYTASINTYREALRILEKVYTRDHPEFISTLYNAAFAFEAADHLDEAMAAYDEVLEFRRKRRGPEHERTLITEMHWAECKAKLGEDDIAEKSLRRVFEAYRTTRPLDDKYTQRALKGLIEFLDAHDNASEADTLRPLVRKI